MVLALSADFHKAFHLLRGLSVMVLYNIWCVLVHIRASRNFYEIEKVIKSVAFGLFPQVGADL
jgi:hypothetical protein